MEVAETFEKFFTDISSSTTKTLKSYPTLAESLVREGTQICGIDFKLKYMSLEEVIKTFKTLELKKTDDPHGGCAIYRLQRNWCIRRSCTLTATCEAPAAINKSERRNSVHHFAHKPQESVLRDVRQTEEQNFSNSNPRRPARAGLSPHWLPGQDRRSLGHRAPGGLEPCGVNLREDLCPAVEVQWLICAYLLLDHSCHVVARVTLPLVYKFLRKIALEIPADQLQAASVLADRCWELSRGQTDKQVTGWTDEHGETIRAILTPQAMFPTSTHELSYLLQNHMVSGDRVSPRAPRRRLSFLEIEILLKKTSFTAPLSTITSLCGRRAAGRCVHPFRTFAPARLAVPFPRRANDHF
ncbi:hypothetical protein EVAR_101900_1 [Eumeta japonica]|uniref:Uncharacterized protein n=1 Tax=Eumeta variegata TaxID=151549 RepID=A0A4C1SQL4_EUMVA|nr:hypothetical protein EVAR_101900_1 [Eumeta japonica]